VLLSAVFYTTFYDSYDTYIGFSHLSVFWFGIQYRQQPPQIELQPLQMYDIRHTTQTIVHSVHAFIRQPIHEWLLLFRGSLEQA